MPQQELLSQVVRALEEARCPYMLIGSYASSLQGEPRLSHDIDLLVDMDLQMLPALAAKFPPPAFSLNEQVAQAAVRTKTMFSLLHVPEGAEVDFWMLTGDPFDLSRFTRRRIEHAVGLRFYVSTPEDTILAKLRWAKLVGGSEKQFHDALCVYEVQHPSLDVGYLKHWVHRLGLSEYWTRLLREAES